MTEQKTSLKWVFDVRSQTKTETNTGEDYNHPVYDSGTFSSSYERHKRVTERSETRRADSLEPLVEALLLSLTPERFRPSGSPNPQDPIYALEVRKSMRTVETNDQFQNAYQDDGISGGMTDKSTERTTHEAVEQRKTRLQPSANGWLPLAAVELQLTERNYVVTDTTLLTRDYDAESHHYGISGAVQFKNRDLNSSMKEIAWDANGAAEGTQTDKWLEEGESHSQGWTAQWWNHHDRTWSNAFDQVFRPLPEGQYEVVQYLGVYRENSDHTGASPGLTSEWHSRMESRDELAGAFIIHTQDRHEWSLVSNGSQTDRYEYTEHSSHSWAAEPHPSRFGMIDAGRS